MVECLTDNRNRTVAEVRHAFSKSGGNLGTDGSVAYLFSKKGLLTFVGVDEDALMDAALEAGADDVVTEEDGSIEVYTTPNDFGTVLDALEAAGFKAQNAEVTMIPSTEAELDAETAPKLMRLIDMLEDLDDVQEVYHNGSISDEVAATLSLPECTLEEMASQRRHLSPTTSPRPSDRQAAHLRRWHHNGAIFLRRSGCDLLIVR